MTESKIHKFKRLASEFLKNNEAQGGVGTLYLVFFAAIIVLAIVIVFTFIPGIGTTVDQSTSTLPVYCTDNTNATTCASTRVAGGEWNASDSSNPNQASLQASSGASIWTSTSGMLKVAMIIGIVVIILGALFAIFQSKKQGGGGM